MKDDLRKKTFQRTVVREKLAIRDENRQKKKQKNNKQKKQKKKTPTKPVSWARKKKLWRVDEEWGRVTFTDYCVVMIGEGNRV